MLKRSIPAVIIGFFISYFGFAQDKSSKLALQYILRVDTTDVSGYDVEMHIKNAPHTFQLAMATHHEYDDRFWRYVENFSVKANDGKGSFVKKDSALWQITIQGSNAVVKYRIHLPLQAPGQERPSQRPFLTTTGGLVGDLHSFMYVVNNIHVPSSVTFEIPASWQIATGLQPTRDSRVYEASTARELMDCPALIGKLHIWVFQISYVPHIVAYWQAPGSTPFDTSAFVINIAKIAQQAFRLYGNIPYRSYTFLVQDNAYGALEHFNSVSFGMPAQTLAENMNYFNDEVAHEFSHTWNLMRIKPAEYTELNYGPKEQSAGLWFSEGLAMYYGDLLVRRAWLATDDATRISHLQSLITRYYSDTGNTFIPPGKVSLAANEPAGALGDYDASTHLQGELIGTMLDIIIRNATSNRRSIDDVMREMFANYGDKKSFYASDIEGVVKNVCDCEVHSFFQAHVYNGSALDFNTYLEMAGMRMNLAWATAKDANGQPAPDMRIFSWLPADDKRQHLFISSPSSAWGRAGLHTNDVLVALNGNVVLTPSAFNDMLKNVHIGDNITLTISRHGNNVSIPVNITGYMVPVVKLSQLENPSPLQQTIYNSWITGLTDETLEQAKRKHLR